MSESSVRNHRKNLLSDARKHIQSVSTIAEKYQAHGLTSITDQDIRNLINLSDKCSNTLKKYIKNRWFSISQDPMLAYVHSEFQSINSPSTTYTLFDHETEWLRRFGSMFGDRCDFFIETQVTNNLSIVLPIQLYSQICDFRNRLGRNSINPVAIRGNFETYLDEVSKIASGTGLVCEDGFRYYVETTDFSSRSIWLGSQMFLSGAESLLRL
jgi:hypothetical protein